MVLKIWHHTYKYTTERVREISDISSKYDSSNANGNDPAMTVI